MSLHVFASIVTSFGTAANNRAENEGNITTLQKLLWMGETHSTVSAEAIRFALRRRLGILEQRGTNRRWDENGRSNTWQDNAFQAWSSDDQDTYIDDDLLGFMSAESAKSEADGGDGKKGSAKVRRAVLEVTRAVSLTPWSGDVTFNAASPGATPSAAKGDSRDKNPVPYGTELHATRYQYSIALTPERLRDQSRAAKAIQAICELGTVAGNHGRFLFDFSPEAVVFRLTADPAPRLLYCFGTPDNGRTVTADSLVRRIECGDVDKTELIVGVSDLGSPLALSLSKAGLSTVGVKAACSKAVEIIQGKLEVNA